MRTSWFKVWYTAALKAAHKVSDFNGQSLEVRRIVRDPVTSRIDHAVINSVREHLIRIKV